MESPITVFDLSGIPTTIVDDMVGAILRILYDAVFWGRMKKEGGRNRPLLLVLEEAHVYLGTQSKGRAATAARRIAKEGRKYGASLCIVTQRPAEIDPTILSQCNTVFALRMSNDRDQEIVTSAIADTGAGLLEFLSALGQREAIAFGDGVTLPVRHQKPELATPSTPTARRFSSSTAVPTHSSR